MRGAAETEAVGAAPRSGESQTQIARFIAQSHACFHADRIIRHCARRTGANKINSKQSSQARTDPRRVCRLGGAPQRPGFDRIAWPRLLRVRLEDVPESASPGALQATRVARRMDPASQRGMLAERHSMRVSGWAAGTAGAPDRRRARRTADFA